MSHCLPRVEAFMVYKYPAKCELILALTNIAYQLYLVKVVYHPVQQLKKCSVCTSLMLQPAQIT